MPIGNMENLQEERVIGLIRELLQSAEFSFVCRCESCFIDIAALALNTLPSEYVADKFSKFPERPDVAAAKRDQAVNAIRIAIGKVTSRPHHD